MNSRICLFLPPNSGEFGKKLSDFLNSKFDTQQQKLLIADCLKSSFKEIDHRPEMNDNYQQQWISHVGVQRTLNVKTGVIIGLCCVTSNSVEMNPSMQLKSNGTDSFHMGKPFSLHPREFTFDSQ